METEPRHLAVSRVFDAPRELVYRACTDPDHLAQWWGPPGPSEQGWLEAPTKLDATLASAKIAADRAGAVA